MNVTRNKLVALFVVGLLIAAVIIYAWKKRTVKEGFWGISAPRTIKVVQEVVMPNGTAFSLPKNAAAMAFDSLGSNRFIQRPSFQPLVTPRFSNVDYGANIKYNMPDRANLASPVNPLYPGGRRENVVKEGFSPTCGIAGTRNFDSVDTGLRAMSVSTGANPSSDGDISTDSYKKAMNKAYTKFGTHQLVDEVEVGHFDTIAPDGTLQQPVVYDRFIVANQKSRLRALGDPIRGDIPIVPHTGGWFNVSVDPQIDLQGGAMNVLGGIDNGTSRSLAELEYLTSGRYKTVIGGLDLTNDFRTTLGAGLGDINIASFA